MRHTLSLTSLLLLATSSLADAKPDVSFSGQVRVREEVRGEIFTPTDPTGEATRDETHLRTRLRADAVVNPQLEVSIELQDVRLFGDELSTVGTIDGVDLKRGFFAVKPTGSDTTVRVGRWVMAYGDQRLIGHLEWIDQGRSYDGIHVAYKPSKTFVDVFAVRVRETLSEKDDQHFGGIYSGIQLGDDFTLDLYALGLRDALEMGATFATIGTRATVGLDRFDASAEVAVQVGEVGESELTAAAAAMKVGYVAWRPALVRLGAEIAYASGDSDPTDSADNTFRTLFPTNHIYYGHADLAAWQNVIALRAGISAKPTTSTSVSLDVHHLRLADSAGGWFNAAGGQIRAGDATASTELGNEADLWIGWKPIDGLALAGGVAVFVGGDFVEETGGGGDALFAYLQGLASF